MQSKTRLVQYLTGACAIWLLMAFTGGVAHWRQLAQDSARTSAQLVELLLMASELRISGEAANAAGKISQFGLNFVPGVGKLTNIGLDAARGAAERSRVPRRQSRRQPG